MAILQPTKLTEEIANNFLADEDIALNFGLSIKPYDIISLVAPTGAGKTTLTCNLFAPLNKPILYFSLEESKETMAFRITNCCGKDALKNFIIIDQGDFISSKDDFSDILDTIKDACENKDKYHYAAIVIDHLTCISSLKKHKNPINLLKQETVKHKIPLFIINQYQNVAGRSENQLAGGREMMFYATLSLQLLKSPGKMKDISEEEQILYNIDLDDIQNEEDSSIYSLDAKRNIKFKSDNLRLLKLGIKNRYQNSFKGVLLDFDLENNRYIIFDKDAHYTEKQKSLIISWNQLTATILNKDYYFDENNTTCYKINNELLGFINNYLLTCDNQTKTYNKNMCAKIKQIFKDNKYYESGIPEMKNLVYKLRKFISNNTVYVEDESVIKLREFITEV